MTDLVRVTKEYCPDVIRIITDKNVGNTKTGVKRA